MIIVRDSAGLRKAAAALMAEDYVGFDLETTGLDPHTTRPRLAQLSTPGEVYVIDLFEFDSLEPLKRVLAAERPIKIVHNAKFDGEFVLKHLGTRLGGLFDTYLASQLISAGNDGDRHGLAPVSLRFLGRTIDKELQVSDWSGELSKAQISYAATDAEVLLPLQRVQAKKLHELGLERVAELEFNCILPLAAMELSGIYLDANRWRVQVAETRSEYNRIAQELQHVLGAGRPQMSLFEDAVSEINLDSPAQIKEALGRLGIQLQSTREGELHLVEAAHPVVAKLIEYRGLSKSLSAYGLGLLDYINPVTGRIHSHFRQIASPSGRMASSSPGLHQIPHENRYRECFRAEEGRRMVVADFSQIEMRILAGFSRDKALVKAFESGEDLHRSTASVMLGVALDKVSSSQRSQAKGLNYGLVYGMGAEGLARRIEVTVPEAERLIKSYFAAFPGVAKWLDEAAEAAVREGCARTASGRLWVFSLDPTDRVQAGALKRIGKNAPIQGTASDMFKRAMVLVDAALEGKSGRIIHCIHDEIVVECDEAEAEETAMIVAERMTAAGREYLPGVPVEVDVKVTEAWLK